MNRTRRTWIVVLALAAAVTVATVLALWVGALHGGGAGDASGARAAPDNSLVSGASPADGSRGGGAGHSDHATDDASGNEAKKGATVFGAVTDARGKPVAGASVTMEYAAASRGRQTQAPPPPPVFTNASGAYTVTALPADFYDVVVLAEGYAETIHSGLAVAPGAAPTALDLVLQDGVALRGRVVRKVGEALVGVPGAAIVADMRHAAPYRGGERGLAPREASSRPDGAFVLTGLAPGVEVRLSAGLGWLEVSRPKPVVLAEGVAPPSVVLRLPDSGTIAGRVALADGSPVEGAEVRVVRAETRITRRTVRLTRATTGADGAFALPDIPKGAECTLEATAPGFAPLRSDGIFCDAPGGTVLTLTRGGRIAGHVKAKEDGRPLQGMKLTVRCLTGDVSQPQDAPPLLTDVAGAFAAEALPPGSYRVEARGKVPDGDAASTATASATQGKGRTYYALAPGNVEVADDGTTKTLELLASACGGIRGRVTMERSDDPVAGAMVSGFGPANNGFDVVRSAADGTFEVVDVAPGAYRVTVRKPGLFAADSFWDDNGVHSGNDSWFYRQSRLEANCLVRPGDVTENVRLTMMPGLVVRGLVLDPGGQPAPQVTLSLDAQQRGAGYTVSGADGRFEFAPVHPHTPDPRVVAESGTGPGGAWLGARCEARPTSGPLLAEVTLRLRRGGAIAGHVIDENRQPIEGARVVCQHEEEASRPENRETMTDAAGVYTLLGLTTGTHTLTAIQDGYVGGPVEDAVVTGEETTAGVDLVLKKTRLIAGSVVDTSGQGLPGWKVKLADRSTAERNEGSGPSVETNADGEFSLPCVRLGLASFRLSHERSGRAGAQQEWHILTRDLQLPESGEAEALVLTVDLAHTVRGRAVRLGSGLPVKGVHASLTVSQDPVALAEGAQCATESANLYTHEVTGDDGVFAFESVPNGPLRLEIHATDGQYRTVGGEVLHGEAMLDLGDIEVEEKCVVVGRLLDGATGQPLPPAEGNGSGHFQPAQLVPTADVTDKLGETRSVFGFSVLDGGRFGISSAPRAVQRITFRLPKYRALEVTDPQMQPEGETDLGDLLLQPGFALTGTLCDQATDQPLSQPRGLQIEFLGIGETNPHGANVSSVGDDGGFEIVGLGGAVQSIKIRASGYVPLTIDAVPPPDEQGRIALGRVALARGGVIEGVVVDAQGAPCPRASAYFEGKEGDGTGNHTNFHADLDAQGKFRVEGLPDGTFKGYAQGPGYAACVVENVVVAADGAPAQVRFELQAGRTLAGTLVDLDTHILSGWWVVAKSVAEGGAETGDVKTDSLGHFEMHNVSSEAVRILCGSSEHPAGYNNTDMRFVTAPVAEGSGEPVYVFPLGPRIVGRLVDEQGRAVAGARLKLSQKGGAPPQEPGTGSALDTLAITQDSATDASGRFTVGPVAVGAAKLEFSGAAFVAKTLDDVRVGMEAEHDVGDVTVQAGGMVVGRFVDKATGGRARMGDNAGIVVRVVRGDAPGGDPGGDPANPLAGALSAKFLGRTVGFGVTGVPPDATVLRFETGSYLPCDVPNVHVTPGGETDLGDVALDPGVAMRVRLVDAATGWPTSVVVGWPPPSSNSGWLSATGLRSGGAGAWKGSGQPTPDLGVYLFRSAPADLRQVTLAPGGFDTLTIDSLPAPDASGVVDLGDRKVKRKP